jgi:hypothetical protein
VCDESPAFIFLLPEPDRAVAPLHFHEYEQHLFHPAVRSRFTNSPDRKGRDPVTSTVRQRRYVAGQVVASQYANPRSDSPVTVNSRPPSRYLTVCAQAVPSNRDEIPVVLTTASRTQRAVRGVVSSTPESYRQRRHPSTSFQPVVLCVSRSMRNRRPSTVKPRLPRYHLTIPILPEGGEEERRGREGGREERKGLEWSDGFHLFNAL